MLLLELSVEVLTPSLLVLDSVREDASVLEVQVFFFHGCPHLGALVEDGLELNLMGFWPAPLPMVKSTRRPCPAWLWGAFKATLGCEVEEVPEKDT